MKQEFSLLEEPWICVRLPDCSVRQVSIREALLHAQDFAGLAGETRTQDFAVFRMLLAIVYTVFTRYDTDGQEIHSEDITEDDMLDLWEMVYTSGKFPAAPFDAYFARWRERFWLFDEAHPFYQCTTVADRNMMSTGKMIGSLFESANKERLFSGRREEGRLLDFAEAARWLLHLNCFDDIAAKHPTPKRTYVGPFSLIALEGKNFFETMMLNFVAVSDHQTYLSRPVWEQDNNVMEYNRRIPMPMDQAELLTIPSRRILLHRSDDGNKVDGYMLSGGDYIEEKDVYAEQETCWIGRQEKKKGPYSFRPMEIRQEDTVKKAWQEFGVIAVADNQDEADHGKRAPGVIRWMKFLLEHRMIERDQMVQISMAAMVYNAKQTTCYPVMDHVSDGLTFHSQLIMDAGYIWRKNVCEVINECDQAVGAVGNLYKKVQYAAGRWDKDDKVTLSGEADIKVRFYAEIDRIFREWLRNLDVDKGEEYQDDLKKQLRGKAIQLGMECLGQAGITAIFGAGASSAKAMNEYCGRINQLFGKKDKKNEGKSGKSLPVYKVETGKNG